MIFNPESVSRETLEKFNIYYEQLIIWNRRTSLIQIDTLEQFWDRHILDSLQLKNQIADKNSIIIDLGSGAGFPGMVLAMLGYTNVYLCESNHRKALFLTELARLSKTDVKILNIRIENLNSTFDYVIARACADLTTLLGYLLIVSRERKSIGLFLKGISSEFELENAKSQYTFMYECIPSITSTSSHIIKVWNVTRKAEI